MQHARKSQKEIWRGFQMLTIGGGDLMDLAMTILSRLPFEKWLVKSPPTVDPWQKLEKTSLIMKCPSKRRLPQPGLTRLQQAQKRKYGVGCRPCTADHLSTCAGALSEALRFARRDGMEDIEAQERRQTRPRLPHSSPHHRPLRLPQGGAKL